MNRRFLPPWLAALLLPALAAAQEPLPCADEPTTPAVNACLVRRLAAQDLELARTLDRLRADWRAHDAQDGSLPVLPALEAAQAAWLAWRDRECEARALTYGAGTGRAAAGLRCELVLSAQRQAALVADWSS
ncbi:MAG: DUF1311 domain-containing protein [Burkholderiales bacterium]|nr:MAG: DUF1311 domain-containing protein [Burkholderiales bacterium]